MVVPGLFFAIDVRRTVASVNSRVLPTASSTPLLIRRRFTSCHPSSRGPSCRALRTNARHAPESSPPLRMSCVLHDTGRGETWLMSPVPDINPKRLTRSSRPIIILATPWDRDHPDRGQNCRDSPLAAQGKETSDADAGFASTSRSSATSTPAREERTATTPAATGTTRRPPAALRRATTDRRSEYGRSRV